jgi:hypothetical protein
MAGLLGDIFGAADTAKRKLRDVVANPLLSAQQFLGNVNDRARNLNEMTAAAALEGVDYGPASQRLGGLLADAYNPVGMFIGPSSPMFNKQMAFEATKLSKRNKTPQEIWQQTGTVKGPDGQWRQEISDAEATLVPQQKKTIEWLDTVGPAEYPVGSINDLIKHDALLKAYPDISKIRATLRKGQSASYFPNDAFNERIISPALIREGKLANPEATKSSTLHELQHAIQEREKFASGGSADDFAFLRDKALQDIGKLNTQMSALAKQLENKSLPKAQQDALRAQYDQVMATRQGLVSNASIDPMQAYGNLMGEAEARLTQRRMNLNPQQRKENFPFQYTGDTGYGLDVPLEGLIYMTQDGTILRRGLLGQ